MSVYFWCLVAPGTGTQLTASFEITMRGLSGAGPMPQSRHRKLGGPLDAQFHFAVFLPIGSTNCHTYCLVVRLLHPSIDN